MAGRLSKRIALLAGVVLVAGGVWRAEGQARRPIPVHAATGTTASINGERVIRYIRERFGIADTVKLTLGSFQSSPLPGFYENTVTVDDGKNTKTQIILVSKDDRYLIVGNVFPISSDSKREIIQHVREVFKVPEATSMTVGRYRDSPFPTFYATAVAADDGKHKQSQDFYVTRDNRFFILGSIFSLGADLKREALRAITTENHPTQGPADAPVTIVEYADLQCPTCARIHQFLENELLPKYGDKVRLVFKEYPLVTIHEWTLTAAIANQCSYQMNPTTFVPYRTLIFQHQSDLDAVKTKPSSVRDLLLGYGEQTGLDRLQLAGCIDAKASLPRIDADKREAEALSVSSTPTFFINGRRVLAPPPEAFYQAVDEALSAKPPLRKTAGHS